MCQDIGDEHISSGAAVNSPTSRAMRLRAFVRDRRFFFVLFLLLLPLLFRPRIYGLDPVGYYSWLRSLVIDGDLDTTNEYIYYGDVQVVGPTVTGLNHDPYAIGAPLFWLPFYLLAHAEEALRVSLTHAPSPDGYGKVYVWAVSLGSALYGLATVLILHVLIRRLFREPTAKIAMIAIWLASPLVFYMYSHPTMAHAVDAFANTLVFAAWFALDRRDCSRNWLWLGATIGLATLVRTQNALLVIIPVIWLAQQATAAPRRKDWLKWARSVGAFLVGGLLTAWPQIVVWRIVFGKWIELSPYSYTHGAAGQFTGTLHILDVLFSTDRGLFVWSPIILFALIGLVLFHHRSWRLSIFLLSNFLAQVIVVSAWSAYNGGVAFGARLLLQSIPVYAVGLAAFVDWLRQRQWSTRRLTVIATGFALWNFVLIIQYSVGTVPRSGSFPLSQLVIGQISVIPAQLGRIVKALLTRQ